MIEWLESAGKYFSSAGQVVIMLLLVLTVSGIAYLIWKRALLDIQQKAMDVQGEVIEAYALRIKQLEDDRDADASERLAMRQEIDSVLAELQSRSVRSIAALELVGQTHICIAAHECDHRVLPAI